MQYSSGFMFYCKCEPQLSFDNVRWDTRSRALFCAHQAWLMFAKWTLVQTQAFHCVSLWLRLPVTLQKKAQWVQIYARWKTSFTSIRSTSMDDGPLPLTSIGCPGKFCRRRYCSSWMTVKHFFLNTSGYNFSRTSPTSMSSNHHHQVKLCI